MYNHAEADIYRDADGDVTAGAGRNYTSQLYGRSIAGKLTMKLYNADAKYSFFNTNSSLYTLIRPGPKNTLTDEHPAIDRLRANMDRTLR